MKTTKEQPSAKKRGGAGCRVARACIDHILGASKAPHLPFWVLFCRRDYMITKTESSPSDRRHAACGVGYQ